MKTKYRFIVLCLVVAIAGFTACKKDGAIVPQVKAEDSTQNSSSIGAVHNLRVVK